MQRFGYLVPLLANLTLAFGCSDTGAENDSQLPSSFGDCASPPCEVALDAFTKNPGTIPHCRSTKDAVDLSCPAATGADTGTCGDNWAVRYVYGFPGDFYECIYDARTGVLVGARWSPDNHPTQFAGEQLPATCQLTAACDGGFAGAGGMGGVGGASGTGGAVDPAFASRDFERIELRQREGIGYCPEDGMVISATIVRAGEGVASIEGIRTVELCGGIQRSFGPSPLGANDVSSLQARIDAIPATEECVFGAGACDPAMYTSLAVDDDTALWSGCCLALGYTRYSESFLALVARIEELAP